MSVTATTGKSPSQKAYYIHTAICLIIIFGFGQLPPMDPLTPLGMNLVGIFLGVLYGWVFIEIVWPSLIGLLALMLVGGMKPLTLWNKSFGDPIVQMMFFIFVFCATINYYGLSKFISLWFITRKFVVGRPWMFTLVFLASMFVLGALTSASPAAIIGWSILYGVCEVCGYKKGDGYPTMMVFGIVFASQVGMSIIPFKQAPLTVLSAYTTLSGTHIDYAKYMLIAAIICAICCGLFVLIGKYIFNPDMDKLRNLDPRKLDTEGSLSLSGVQKTILVFLMLLVALLLAPNFLPSDFFVTRFLKSIGNTGVVMLLVSIMACIRVDGKPLLRFKAMVDSGVTWSIVLLLAFVQPLSSQMASPSSGITTFLMQAMEPLMGGGSPLIFTLVIGFVAAGLTQVMNNGAVGVALMPVVYSYCKAAGIPPELPVIMVVMCVHYAFLTPAASASAALLHGNEWADAKSIWRTAPIVIFITWLVTALVIVALGSLIF
ncbi:SLC13 family permease [Desulfovibrio desulfuricans]|uniref:SLC13 family permease n=1 Tax=Desulfovibrio desulfuricans TaxID=876 RepID=UPI001D067C18|nr:SLC13 family permease [Desulfovibrio desulfuricans]MCB6543253.1 SLC13 family permease [Desulfovibrio desulfuricans]MCB6554076.1 SLC13 family permease [Desulfovibrio desulfuricans]MCB6565990.1 SLC13 family permease [Desulfovibrio desulfuricans]MCB7347120.1 SLC13 family permease [Desulfovibrio desulfuricans]MCQ5219368.1 SLC13 family permease [Desulfovibrio desulfuricans]